MRSCSDIYVDNFERVSQRSVNSERPGQFWSSGAPTSKFDAHLVEQTLTDTGADKRSFEQSPGHWVLRRSEASPYVYEQGGVLASHIGCVYMVVTTR